MKNTILLITLFVLFHNNAYSSECNKWQYSNLTILKEKIIEEDQENDVKILKGVNIHSIWNEPTKSGVWINNKKLGGNINSDLKTYFKISSISNIKLVNSIGEKGWEPFSIDYKVISEREEKYYYHFKRCS